MKKNILPLLAVSLLVVAMPALAAPENPPIGEVPVVTDSIWELLTRALNWFFNAAIIVAALFLVMAGWQYITAAGDETKAKKGLSTLTYALIGVGIALLAKGLIYIVGSFLGTSINF